MERLPAIFISHGMPSMALDPGPTGRFLSALPRRCEPPRAIVCIAAHLEAERNHPYPAEHFLPLLVTPGAGAAAGSATRLHRHFEYGILSLAAYRGD